MINRLNIYQVLFAALLLLKIGEVGKFADFSWWLVLLPYFLGLAHNFLMWTMRLMNIQFEDEIAQMYLDTVRKRASKKAMKDLIKEQEEQWPKRN